MQVLFRFSVRVCKYDNISLYISDFVEIRPLRPLPSLKIAVLQKQSNLPFKTQTNSATKVDITWTLEF